MLELDKLYERAEEAFQKNNFDYACDLFNQIITLDPNHSNARKALWATLVRKYQVIGAPSKVKLAFLNVKTMGQISIFKNNSQKKIGILQDYLTGDPNNLKMRVHLAESLKEAGYIDGAIAELQIAIDIQKDFAPALKLLSSSYKEKGMITEAEDVLQKVLQYAPDDREAGKLLRDITALSSLKKGFEDAKSYRDVLKDGDKAEELEKRQHLIRTEEDIQKEINDLQKALQDEPQNVKIVKKIGDMYFDRKKDYESARNWYKKAVELNPTDTSLKNRTDDCTIRLFDIQIEKAENTNDTKNTEIKKNKLAFEIQSYERRIADQPTDMGLRFELAKRYYTAGQIDKAIAEFQQSVKDPKRTSDSHLYLGMGFRHKKLFDLAISQFEKAFKGGVLTGDKPLFIRYNMACCYGEAGNYAKAVEEGKKIMEIDINYKDISKLITEWSKK